MQQVPNNKSHPLEVGLCARRLRQYMYHEQCRPQDNSIKYWRKLVKEYYDPQAKVKWCLSSYGNIGNHAPSVLPQTSLGAWHCNLCDSKSGKGFVASVEILPRLNQTKFDSGVIKEHCFLDEPFERRMSSGIMVLEYKKAVQETVYEQLNVVREGRLRIIFSKELKILNWEFCTQPHEYFLRPRYIAPQMEQLEQVVEKYQASISESGSSGVSRQDLEDNYNMFMTAGKRLGKSLDLQSFNDFGYSERYLRFLQVYQVVDRMKDLISFSSQHENGPLESLKIYPQQFAAKRKRTEREQQVFAQSLAVTVQNTVNRITNIHPGISSHANSNLMGIQALNNSGVTNAVSFDSYQNMLSSASPHSNSFHLGPLYSYANHGQAQLPIVASGAGNDFSRPEQHSLISSGVNQQQRIQPVTKEPRNVERSQEQQLGMPPDVNINVPGEVPDGGNGIVGLSVNQLGDDKRQQQQQLGVPPNMNINVTDAEVYNPGLFQIGMDMELVESLSNTNGLRVALDRTSSSVLNSTDFSKDVDNLLDYDDVVQEFDKRGLFGDGPGDLNFL